MKNDNLTAEASVSINAPASKVWKALTTPELIKKYLMGTNVTTNWKVGSPISYAGEYEGKKYLDKGIIKKLEPEKVFQSTYWSPMSGKADQPENYKLVTYELLKQDNGTLVKLTQDNNANEKEKEHTTGNWKVVLEKLKYTVECE